MSAGGRHYGVVLAERGRADDAPPLSDAERDGLWTLGKVCALAASARAATRQQERARHLGDRLDLARDVHERVIQRLFGVTLALGAPGDLTQPQRERCADELQAATEELRLTIQRPLAQQHRGDASAADAPALRDEVRRLAAEHAEIEFIINWPDDLEVPAALDPLAQTVVAEAVRNARKHARPRAIAVTVASEQDGGALAIDVANDGVGPDAPAGAGVGLRLAAFEALEFGAAVDFGRLAPDRWHVRLVLPLPGDRDHHERSSRMSALDAPPRRLCVLVVDDHDIVHWGMRLVLVQQDWVERCVPATTGDEAEDRARRYGPHVALVDLFVGDESGTDIARRVRAVHPATRVLLLSGAGRISATAAKAAGAAGFVTKDRSAAEIVEAIRRIGAGEDVFEQPRGGAVRTAPAACAAGRPATAAPATTA